MPLVTVLIVNWNAGDFLSSCISSIPNKYPIIIVDNNSSDNSIQSALKARPQIKLIKSKTNLGFSAGNNLGLKEVTSQYVLFLNPDTVILGDAIEQLVTFLEKNPDYVAVGPQIIDANGHINLLSGRRSVDLWASICQAFLLDKIFPHSRIFNRLKIAEWSGQQSRDVDCLVGCAMLVRTAIVKAIGGFDEQVPLFLDDIDLCRRLLRKGKIYCLTSAVIRHIHNVCGMKAPFYLINFMRCEARYIYLKKHAKRPHAIIFRLALGLAACARMVVMEYYSLLRPAYHRNYEIARDCLTWAIFREVKRKYIRLQADKSFQNVHSLYPTATNGSYIIRY